MKAAAYTRTGGPEVLEYVDVADPVVREGGVVLAVEAIGIQGGDLLNRAGGAMASTPHIVGYQAAGRVHELGSDVSGFEVDQPVVATMAFGSHAEMASVPAGSVYAIPDGLTIEDAAGVPIEFGTADDCLFEFGHLRAGSRCWSRLAPAGSASRRFSWPPAPAHRWCWPPRRATSG